MPPRNVFSKQLTTVGLLRTAIKQASCVYVRPRFGVSEHWVKITKNEAMYLVSSYDDTVTADSFEMHGGTFGGFEGKTLYLG